MTNPFKPGAGRKPPYLAGRTEILHAVKTEMQQVCDDAEGMRPVVISGLRGMGKTVLLRELADFAKQRAWVVACVEASRNTSLATKLSQALYLELRRIKNSANPLKSAFDHAIAVLKSFQLKIDPAGSYSLGIDIQPAQGYADSGDLSLDLGDLLQATGEAARDAGTAVFLSIDELQEASKEDLTALNVALHAIGQGSSPVPVYFIGAGLPTLPAVLADATSYAERMFAYHSLELLSDDAVRDAYIEPTAKDGIRWEENALAAAIEAAGGYPYFIQQCGFCICEQIEAPGIVTSVETAAGIALAKNELDRGLYRSRWDRTTRAGRAMMRAMASAGSPIKLSDLAQQMGKRRISDLSVIRDKLIHDGLIYAPERGHVTFTVPGMDDFILRCSE
ncbi:ATP-binding protein [Rubneribacter sp.]